MKKIKLLFVILGVILLSGCNITKDSMEDIEIYTTLYPIKYLINSLYGTNGTINSIYPSGVDVNDFELSDKKLKEYSKTDLFVFNSLDRDRDIAVKMINENKNLKVIDVSMGMTYDNNIEELWLNPYNYLMMAENTKNGLLEYVSNPYLISNTEGTGIEDKYEVLKYDLSRLDADIKESISLAKYKTVVVDSNLFKYLEKYNLNVISLDKKNSEYEKNLANVKYLINNNNVKYIYLKDNETNTDIKNLIKNTNVSLIKLNTLSILTDEQRNNYDYLTLMTENLEKLKKQLYNLD